MRNFGVEEASVDIAVNLRTPHYIILIHLMTEFADAEDRGCHQKSDVK